MRTHTIDVTLKSNLDLTKLSSRRVNITRIDGESFRVVSELKLFKCERALFVGRYLRRKEPRLTHFTGGCSKPTGYYAS
jgi:hypothetical protein